MRTTSLTDTMLVVLAGLMVLPPVAAFATSLNSVRVELPAGDRRFPEAPGSAAADGNCLPCHSVEMVLNQPALSRAGWEAVVAKMRNVYKAPINAEEVGTIVEYLLAIQGLK
jgi:hypothetical protein